MSKRVTHLELYLFRHGECFRSSNRYFDSEKKTMNPPLTDLGIEQAKKLAWRCKDLKFDIILTCDLCRAQQTAEILKCLSTVRPDKAFREIDMGDIYTKSWDEFSEIYAKWSLHENDMPYPNGENGEAVWQRCKKALIPMLNKYKRIAIVCHGGTIRSIICGLLDIPQEKRFYLGLPPKNCSITVFKYNEKDRRFYLHIFNNYTHLLD